MAMDGDDARASSPPPLDDPDHLSAPPSAAAASAPATATALDLTNEHLPTLDGVELPETLEVRRSFQGGRRGGFVFLSSFFFSFRGAQHAFSLSLFPFLSQTVDLTANRLKELDDRLLALPSE